MGGVGPSHAVGIAEILSSLVASRKDQTEAARRQDLVAAVLPDGGNEHLALNPVFGAFVTFNAGFRAELQGLKAAVDEYAQKLRPPRPLNILLAAPSGTGKSFLVKQLALAMDGRATFAEFYVSSFRSRDDLTSVFHLVQSTSHEGHLPIVFLDEVDCQVEERPLFTELLAPMWDGCFFKGSERRTLGPAIFFFAGSDLLPAPSIREVLGTAPVPTNYESFALQWQQVVKRKLAQDTVAKLRDFIDRSDLLLCIPPIDPTLTDGDARSEYWALACAIVCKYHRHVTRVEKAAVWALSRLMIVTESRRVAESAVFMSRTPPGKTFRFMDLPARTQRIFQGETALGTLGSAHFRLTP